MMHIYMDVTICRCFYHYDALGNMYRKNCSDLSSFEYLVDPFGEFGADIVAEVTIIIIVTRFAVSSSHYSLFRSQQMGQSRTLFTPMSKD